MCMYACRQVLNLQIVSLSCYVALLVLRHCLFHLDPRTLRGTAFRSRLFALVVLGWRRIVSVIRLCLPCGQTFQVRCGAVLVHRLLILNLHSLLLQCVDCCATLSTVSVWSEYPVDTSTKPDTSAYVVRTPVEPVSCMTM